MKASASPLGQAIDHRVTLRRVEVYDVQAFSIRPGNHLALDGWLERSGAIERQFGGCPLMAFEPVKALYGEYLPTLVRMVAWRNTEACDARRRDPTGIELDAQLDELVAESTTTLMRMHPEIHANPDEVEIELDERLCYELCTFWDRPDAVRASWDAFIAAATPSIAAHGGHPLLVFQPLRRVRGDFFPTRFCIAAWDTVAHFESFVTAPEQQEISRLRWLAVSRMDATATRLRGGPTAVRRRTAGPSDAAG